jgi:hypothetical protein
MSNFVSFNLSKAKQRGLYEYNGYLSSQKKKRLLMKEEEQSTRYSFSRECPSEIPEKDKSQENTKTECIVHACCSL